MRLLSFILMLAAAPALLPVQAAGADTIVTRQAPAAKLDKLFAALKKSKSEVLARSIADDIRNAWLESGSANVDLMMQWALDASEQGKNEAALDWLDKVVMLKPDYAEGWNRRATLHYMMNDYSKAMADIQRTLALEPRHFGALSGMAMIFMAYDKKEKALAVYRKVLDIYPMQRDVQQTVGQLEDEIAGSRI